MYFHGSPASRRSTPTLDNSTTRRNRGASPASTRFIIASTVARSFLGVSSANTTHVASRSTSRIASSSSPIGSTPASRSTSRVLAFGYTNSFDRTSRGFFTPSNASRGRLATTRTPTDFSFSRNRTAEHCARRSSAPVTITVSSSALSARCARRAPRDDDDFGRETRETSPSRVARALVRDDATTNADADADAVPHITARAAK